MSLYDLLSRLILSPDERALLRSLRLLSQTDRQFIRRAVAAMAQHSPN